MIVFAVLSVICLAGVVVVAGYETSNATNICCDGTIGPIGSTCCGNKTYNPSEQFCCDNELYKPEKEGAIMYQLQCCSGSGTKGKVYNSTTEVCCGGELSPALPGINAANFYSCCDNPKTNTSQSYLTSIYVCCNGELRGKPTSYDYYGCCGDELLQYPDYRSNCPIYYSKRIIAPNYFEKQCCGTQEVFDPTTQICAYSYDQKTKKDTNKVLNKTDENSASCGLELYDTKTQNCCGQTVFNMSEGICCNNIVKKTDIPSQFSSCCYVDGAVFDIQTHYCNASAGVTKLDDAVADIYKANLKNCGPTFPANIFGNVVEYGYVSSNGTHICCNGEKGTVDMQCCGNGGIYDPAKKVCCNNQLFDPKEGQNASSSSCCPSDDNKMSQPFDYSAEVCCSGHVMRKDPNDTTLNACCHNPATNVTVLYSYANALCCDGVFSVKPNKSNNYECCGDKLIPANYGTVYEDGRIVGFGKEYCCGGKKLYDRTKQICAYYYDQQKLSTEFQVLDKIDNNTDACALKPFDTKTQGCCGNSIYSLSNQICCNLKIVDSKIPFQYSSCCYQDSNAYDVTKQSCDTTGVVDLDPAKAQQNKITVDKCEPTFPPNVYLLNNNL